jgi:hypothetical protein
MPKGADLLATYYIENDYGYHEALLAAGFEEYGYQNATDRPAKVSEAEWLQRKEDWNATLPRGTTPSMVGFQYDVVTWDALEMALSDRDLVISCKPSDDKRIQAVSMRLTEMGPGENLGDLGLWEIVQRLKDLELGRRESITLCAKLFG